MATDDKETLTIRLPKGLKELVDRAAQDRETTVTNFVREALQKDLAPTGRMYQHPGLSERFEQFLEQKLEVRRKRLESMGGTAGPLRSTSDPREEVILL